VSQSFSTWVSGIENSLGLPLDFSCYVMIDNTRGASDLLLTAAANHGWYVVSPPSWIRRGTVGRFILQDPKPSIFGSEGSATYTYCDASLAMQTVVFSYECPTGFTDNRAASSQADWPCVAKSGDPNGPWSGQVPGAGHPLYAAYVAGDGSRTKGSAGKSLGPVKTRVTTLRTCAAARMRAGAPSRLRRRSRRSRAAR